jgi:hypothetical protein
METFLPSTLMLDRPPNAPTGRPKVMAPRDAEFVALEDEKIGLYSFGERSLLRACHK